MNKEMIVLDILACVRNGTQRSKLVPDSRSRKANWLSESPMDVNDHFQDVEVKSITQGKEQYINTRHIS